MKQKQTDNANVVAARIPLTVKKHLFEYCLANDIRPSEYLRGLIVENLNVDNTNLTGI